LITRKIFGEQYRSLITSLCSLFQSPVTSSLLHPNITLSTLFSNTSSLNVNDRVSHSYKTTSKIMVLWVLIFIFLEKTGRQKTLHRMCRRACQASICLTCTSTHTLNWEPAYLFSLKLLCWFVPFVLVLSSQ
jgi:hypothetical protein